MAGLSQRLRSMNNLAEMSALDERSLLEALQDRYDADLIYTNVGEILIATNPFRPLPIYGPSTMSAYKRPAVDYGGPAEMPHIFAVARRAYEDLLATRRDQVCIISGESGAGKTESCKFLVRQVSVFGTCIMTASAVYSTNSAHLLFRYARKGLSKRSAKSFTAAQHAFSVLESSVNDCTQ